MAKVAVLKLDELYADLEVRLKKSKGDEQIEAAWSMALLRGERAGDAVVAAMQRSDTPRAGLRLAVLAGSSFMSVLMITLGSPTPRFCSTNAKRAR